ncbi:DUF2848 domain-containing protein [Dinoroseobacter sp. PD6]|uniref:DUF2848 domain-containing protein n=1 Tax=Dinoroseobacter sp. PD6 TaxID=3028384 RepID=UPI00237A5A5A|nr:DUF2848 domain-containing protein [Dinoroseobacter sp. PD6]MDD9717975.1 DUF2848 domain-containing protein [Dinoroseobacter sp. PD6]
MRFDTPTGPLEVTLSAAHVAGWTGRDRAAVDHHIAELAEIGVPPPSDVPLYYRVARDLLTQAEEVQVLGPDTSGEVEPLILRVDGALWLGLASDHTDRALEAVSVAASKQICAKPVGRGLWPLAEVESHLDQLRLTCDIEEGGDWVRYQEGTLASIRPLPELIAGAGLGEGSAMLCGTLAAKGGVRPAARYRMSLIDPVRDRALSLAYAVTTLPVVA